MIVALEIRALCKCLQRSNGLSAQKTHDSMPHLVLCFLCLPCPQSHPIFVFVFFMCVGGCVNASIFKDLSYDQLFFNHIKTREIFWQWLILERVIQSTQTWTKKQEEYCLPCFQNPFLSLDSFHLVFIGIGSEGKGIFKPV